jgi:hypothetical protein
MEQVIEFKVTKSRPCNKAIASPLIIDMDDIYNRVML